MHTNKFTIFILVVAALSSATMSRAQFWINPSGGDWATNTNWSSSSIPDGPGTIVTFGVPGSGTRTISLTSFWGPPNFIVGEVHLNDPSSFGISYHLDNSFNLIFDTGTMSPRIVLDPGNNASYQIDSNIFINQPQLTISNMSNVGSVQTLFLNGSINDYTFPMTSYTGIGTAPAGWASGLRFTGNAASLFQVYLNGANNFTGNVDIGAQVMVTLTNGMALGGTTGMTTVQTGGSLQLLGSIYVSENSLWLDDSGPTGQGALVNLSGNNTVDAWTVIGNTSPSAVLVHSMADSLTLTGASAGIRLNNDLLLETDIFSSIILDNNGMNGVYGTGGITKYGAGTAVLMGNTGNTYTGLTLVRDGTLELSKAAAGILAINAQLQIGDGAGGPLTAVTTWNQHEQVRDSANVNVVNDGWLNLNGYKETIQDLTFQGGRADLVGGALRLQGNLFYNADPDMAWIEGSGGQLEFNTPGTAIVHVNFGGGYTIYGADLMINSEISGNPTFIDKNGPGTVVFAENNTYNGVTHINSGVIWVMSGNALGNSAASDYTEIMAGAALRITENIFSGSPTGLNESYMRINGDGVDQDGDGIGDGAIVNGDLHTGFFAGGVGGNNKIGARIDVMSNSTVGSILGDLDFSGIFRLTGGNLTINTAAGTNVSFMNTIMGSPGYGLHKINEGRAVLYTANSYFGDTYVDEGILEIHNDTSLGNLSGITYTSVSGPGNIGGAVHFTNNIKVSEVFKIAGDGVDMNFDGIGDGALYNLSGTNTLLGDIAVAGDATIGAGSGRLIISNSGVSTISLNSNLTFFSEAGALIRVDREISDPSGWMVTKTGAGDLMYTGSAANTYVGDTNVMEGTLRMTKTTFDGAIQGALIIDTMGTVLYGNSDQVNDSSYVRVGGFLDMNGFKDTIDTLGIKDGLVDLNGGYLMVNSGVLSFAGGVTSVIQDSIGGGALILNAFLTPVDVQDGTPAIDLSVTSEIIAPSGFLKTGLGTMEVSNTVTTGAIQVDQGRLQLGADNIIDDSATLTLNGGTFATGDSAAAHSDVIGMLSLTANSTLDMGTGSSVLTFNNFDTATYSMIWGTVLKIDNWSGSMSGLGLDQIYFPTSLAADPDFLNFLSNIDWTGSGYGIGATQLSWGEIVPTSIPEPSAVAAAVLLTCAIAWRERHRIHRGMSQFLRFRTVA